MDKIKRTERMNQKRGSPFLKAFFLTLGAVGLMLLGFFGADLIMRLIGML